jgi:DNA-binding NarL/FixJ family response regulator
MWSASERPYIAAYAQWRQAEALFERGYLESAAQALRDAHAIALGLPAPPLLEAIQSLARRSRIDLAQSGSTKATANVDDPFSLTAREHEVLALIADGRTNRQIAHTLFISEHSTGVHVSRILGKLGATSRTEAASIAHRAGIVHV